MSATLLSYLVSSIIAGEIVLFAILQVANRAGARPKKKPCVGWFYFVLCLGMFAMAGTSLFAYLDTFKRLRELDDAGKRYLAATDLMFNLTQMETGHRGFLLTGRSSYLEPYRKGSEAMPAKCKQLRDVFRGTQADVKADAFCKLAESKAKEMAATISLREHGRQDEMLERLNTDVGRDTMDLARVAANDLIQSDLGRYNQIKAQLVGIAEGRIMMAILVCCGAVVQMWLGAFGAWRDSHPVETKACPT